MGGGTALVNVLLSQYSIFFHSDFTTQ